MLYSCPVLVFTYALFMSFKPTPKFCRYHSANLWGNLHHIKGPQFRDATHHGNPFRYFSAFAFLTIPQWFVSKFFSTRLSTLSFPRRRNQVGARKFMERRYHLRRVGLVIRCICLMVYFRASPHLLLEISPLSHHHHLRAPTRLTMYTMMLCLLTDGWCEALPPVKSDGIYDNFFILFFKRFWAAGRQTLSLRAFCHVPWVCSGCCGRRTAPMASVLLYRSRYSINCLVLWQSK